MTPETLKLIFINYNTLKLIFGISPVQSQKLTEPIIAAAEY